MFCVIVGYSGEDQPRTILPSIVGTYEEDVRVKPTNMVDEGKGEDEDVEMRQEGAGVDTSTAKKERRVLCGSPALNFKRDHMQIEPLF